MAEWLNRQWRLAATGLCFAVFGLGGLGTELRLSLQSLEFRELWSGLWLLLAVTVPAGSQWVFMPLRPRPARPHRWRLPALRYTRPGHWPGA